MSKKSTDSGKCPVLWSVSKLETNFSEQKNRCQNSAFAESHRVKSRAPVAASLRHVFFVLFRCQVVEAVRKNKMWIRQNRLPGHLAGNSSPRQGKSKYNHAKTHYVKEMNEHILQNDTTRHRTRDTMWETNEETCKQTPCKTIQPRNPRKDTMRETNASKCTQTCWKMIPANAPSSGNRVGDYIGK